MDILLEKKKGIRKKHLPYIAGGAAVVLLLSWIVFGNHAATLRVDARSLSIGDVKRDQFNDFVRVDGQVQPITIVQLSPEEGGIVQELVVEEGARVHRGDVIVRLSNANLELQILNAEAELAEKQNLLRNTQVTMEQDRLRNKTEELQLDLATTRSLRNYRQQESCTTRSSPPGRIMCRQKKTTNWRGGNIRSLMNDSVRTHFIGLSKWIRWKITS